MEKSNEDLKTMHPRSIGLGENIRSASVAALTRIIHRKPVPGGFASRRAARLGGAGGADCRGLGLEGTGSGGARSPAAQGGSSSC